MYDEYIVVSPIVFVASLFLFRRATGIFSLYRPTVISFIFWFQLILMSFVGANLALIGVEHYIVSRASARAIAMGFFAVSYTMIAMPIAMLFVQKYVFGISMRQKEKEYFVRPLVPLCSPRDTVQIVYWGVVSLVAFVATLYTYYRISDPPLLALLRGLSAEEFARLRIKASREFAGNIYVRNILSLQLAPFVSYVAYAYHKLYPKRWAVRLWFLFTVLVALASVTYDGAKAPVVQYLLGLFFLKTLIDGRARKRTLVIVTLVALVIVILLYSVTTPRVTLAINTGPIGRLVLGQYAGLPMTFDTFPERHPFLWGASFPGWLTNLFRVEHQRSARVLMELYNPRGVAAGTAGVMNTLFIAEAWANFGWLGFLLAPLVVGVIIQTIVGTIIVLPKAPPWVALLASLYFGFPVTGGFVDFLWNVPFVFLVVLIMVGAKFRDVRIGGLAPPDAKVGRSEISRAL